MFDIVTVDNDSESFGLSASFDVANVEFFFRRILLTSGGGKLAQVDVVVRVAESKLVERRLELIAVPKKYYTLDHILLILENGHGTFLNRSTTVKMVYSLLVRSCNMAPLKCLFFSLKLNIFIKLVFGDCKRETTELTEY